MSKEIKLTQGKFAIVDDEDYDWLMQFKWYAMKCKNTFYAVRKRNQKTILMHREIMHAPAHLQVDHINHCGLNNKKLELRLCTIQQQHQNRLPHKRITSSKYKGVYWFKLRRKWRSHIRHNSKDISLGLFDNEIDAAIAYDKAAIELYGEFAYLNFPFGD